MTPSSCRGCHWFQGGYCHADMDRFPWGVRVEELERCPRGVHA